MPSAYRRPFAFAIATADPLWHALDAPDTPRDPWNPASTALRRPPFAALTEGSLFGRHTPHPLLVVGDDITNDHISPASAIPRDSQTADILVARGDDRDDVNVSLLAEKGVPQRQPDRGYFLVEPIGDGERGLADRLGLDESGVVTQVYFRVADDRLRGLLPDEFPEALLKQRYGLTPAQLNAVLGRIASEGWAEKNPGHGWVFSSMPTTADSLLQSYRLRLALAPAALREPGYRLAPNVVARCRAAEMHLLDGGIETDTADQLHERGVRFHESLIEGSGNAFFIDTIRRVDRVRRLLSYRSMHDRSRYFEHCRQHLGLLDLLERGRNEAAAEAMHAHLSSTLRNVQKISGLLKT